MNCTHNISRVHGSARSDRAVAGQEAHTAGARPISFLLGSQSGRSPPLSTRSGHSWRRKTAAQTWESRRSPLKRRIYAEPPRNYTGPKHRPYRGLLELALAACRLHADTMSTLPRSHDKSRLVHWLVAERTAADSA